MAQQSEMGLCEINTYMYPLYTVSESVPSLKTVFTRDQFAWYMYVYMCAYLALLKT